MKNQLSLLFVAATCLATSCFNLTEEYFFNADKSGRYVMTFDLTRMMTTGIGRQSFEKQRDSLIAIGAPLVIDSSFSLLARDPDSVRQLIKKPELFEKCSGRMLLDYDKKQMLVQMIFNFKDLPELRLMQAEWQAYQRLKDSLKAGTPDVENPASDLPSAHGFQGFASEKIPEMSFDGRQFSMAYQFMPSSDSDYNEMLKDDSAFVRNMLKSLKYNLVFHFPSQVKKADGEGFVVEGKTVSYKTDFFNLLKFKDSPMKLDVKLAK